MTGRWRSTLATVLLGCSTVAAAVQTWPFPWPEDRVARYTARRVSSPIVVDGRLDEAAWRAVERSPRFADLVGGHPGIHDTRAALLWDDTYLYVGYWVEEPFVEATLTERDAPIYQDNDVELFIAGRDAYYELEINAFGTIYEVFFVWEREFASSGYARRPEFDRTRQGVRPFNGVGFTKHPRGPRVGYWNWDMPGLETAVHVDGTINDNKDRDRGWTVEMRIPWRSLEPLAMPDRRALPPQDGDEWRMDFSRFNQYKEAPPAKDPGGWAWSPHGVWDSHIPELFTRVRFSTEAVGAAPAAGPRDKVPMGNLDNLREYIQHARRVPGPPARATIYNQMVVGRHPAAHALDQLFGALADATRRDILARVMDAEASVSELAARYEMSFAAVQKHVAVLERAQLVTKRKDGRAQRVAGNPEAVRRANRLLAQFEERWQARVARLDELLATSPEGDPNADRRDSQGPQGADHDRRRPVRRARRPRVGRLR